MTANRQIGFWLTVYVFVATMMGTTLPTPLFPIYQQRLGVGEFTITVIFAVYAAGVLAGLLLMGKLSDEVGRRPVLLVALALGILSAVISVVVPGLSGLTIARVLSGLSAGVITGTATAALVDLAPPSRSGFASSTSVAANLGGLSAGPLIAGLLAQFAPDSLVVPYLVNLALLVLAVLAVLATPETVVRRGRLALRFGRVGVPSAVRGVFVLAGTTGFCAFAVSGFFSAVSPTLLATVLGLPSHALAGVVVSLVFGASVAGQIAIERLPARVALSVGCIALVVGVTLIAEAMVGSSLAALMIAALIAGVGQGLAVGGGLVALSAGAPPERRSEVASSFFVVLYVGLSLPVIGVGIAVLVAGLERAVLLFSAAIALTVLAVLAWLVRARMPGSPAHHGQT